MAKQTARQAKSKELAANALLESSKEKRDETVALRLAYTALKIDTTKEGQNIFDKIILRADNQFYLRKVKGYFRGFNRDKSLFYIQKDNYTAFYNWDGQLTGVYKGEVFYFKADNQHVVMRIPNGGDDVILETRRLYKTIHEFMQNEVAELTPEERVQYGVDDYPKD